MYEMLKAFWPKGCVNLEQVFYAVRLRWKQLSQQMRVLHQVDFTKLRISCCRACVSRVLFAQHENIS